MTKSVKVRDLELGTGDVKICVPLTGRTREELVLEAAAARESGADLAEWRADYYLRESGGDLKQTGMDIRAALGKLPLLFTIRTRAEGGEAALPGAEYEALNIAAAESEFADLVDVEVFQAADHNKELIRRLKEAGVKVIGSSHDFEKTDEAEDLLRRFQEIDRTGADILKMAVMPRKLSDVAVMMKVADFVRRRVTERPLIAIAMGEMGAVSRLTGELYGSCITFGTAGAASAPGQFPVNEIRKTDDWK